MVATYLFALAASLTAASAQAIQGFNSGNTFVNGAAKTQSDFEAEMVAAQNLAGTDGSFTNFRLYTMVQAGTTNTPISAIPAAIDTDTGLLLGLWASAGQAVFDNELIALRNAIQQYGTDFTSRVVGISVGSEDLYRISPTGIANEAGIGAGPDVIANYIRQVREVIAGTPLSGAGVGHVDTWTAWVNGSNSAVVEASDWVGMNAFPYFQAEVGDNSIEQGGPLFFDAYDATVGAVGGKPVWITETGWPYQGPTVGVADASIDNAQSYWNQVACQVLGNINTFWYTLRDANAANAASFGILGDDLDASSPQWDLSCAAENTTSTSTSASSTATATGGAGGRGGNGNGASTTEDSGLTATPVPIPTNVNGSMTLFPTGGATGGATGGSSSNPTGSTGPTPTSPPIFEGAATVSKVNGAMLLGAIAGLALFAF